MSSKNPNNKSWVKLNVGGKIFLTTKTTLAKHPHSFLYRLIKESELDTDKDENGAYLIDRDPNYFAPILNYLRHDKLVIDQNLSDEGVLEESEFYNIPELVKMIKIKMNDKKLNPIKDEVKHVYRVIHCQEHELTQTISSLSDGWKFKQLVNVGSSTYNYDGKNEYLCIVYRLCPINKYEINGYGNGNITHNNTTNNHQCFINGDINDG